jgi:hypothetical protein
LVREFNSAGFSPVFFSVEDGHALVIIGFRLDSIHKTFDNIVNIRLLVVRLAEQLSPFLFGVRLSDRQVENDVEGRAELVIGQETFYLIGIIPIFL